MAAMQLSVEPEIRKKVRRDFERLAKISTKLTKKGEKEIDEDHGLYHSPSMAIWTTLTLTIQSVTRIQNTTVPSDAKRAKIKNTRNFDSKMKNKRKVGIKW